MALRTPTEVRASIQSLGSTTVDYAINWAISYFPGVHPGPYEVTVGYSKDGAAYTGLITLFSGAAPDTSTTHAAAALNSTYTYRVSWYCGHCDEDSPFGSSNTIATYSDSPTESVSLTDEVTVSESTAGSSVLDSITMSETIEIELSDIITESVTMTDVVRSGATLKTDYAYYLADEDGNVYTYSGDYKSYNGSAVESYVRVKKVDYSDLYQEALGKHSTTYRAKLTYVDKGEHFVTFYHSTDGGVAWTGIGRTIGTVAASAKVSVAYFDFIASSDFFNYKLECSTTVGDFQWIALEFEFSMGGEAFPI